MNFLADPHIYLSIYLSKSIHIFLSIYLSSSVVRKSVGLKVPMMAFLTNEILALQQWWMNCVYNKGDYDEKST